MSMMDLGLAGGTGRVAPKDEGWRASGIGGDATAGVLEDGGERFLEGDDGRPAGGLRQTGGAARGEGHVGRPQPRRVNLDVHGHAGEGAQRFQDTAQRAGGARSPRCK